MQNSGTPINQFDRGKPFYPLVTNYITSIFGIMQVSIYGAIALVESGEKGGFDINQCVRQWITENKVAENDAQNLQTAVTELAGDLELRSEFQGDPVKARIEDVGKELVKEHKYLLGKCLEVSAGSLLLQAYEICKDKGYVNGHVDNGPLWEFLFHCRNAAAHLNKFHFQNNQPRFPAEWGNFKIDKNLEGTPLLQDDNKIGLLPLGDPIRLLWDIEQANPHMTA